MVATPTKLHGPIQLKRSGTAGVVPAANELADGQPFVNLADEVILIKNAAGIVVPVRDPVARTTSTAALAAANNAVSIAQSAVGDTVDSTARASATAALATAAAAISSTQKGTASGVASLGTDGKCWRTLVSPVRRC
jgi:hypothetical protein